MKHRVITDQNGMTLIETLITLALMAGIMTVVFSLNDTVSRVYKRDIDQARTFLEVQSVIASLKTEFVRHSTITTPTSSYIEISSFTSEDISSPVMDRLRVTFLVKDTPYQFLLEKPHE